MKSEYIGAGRFKRATSTRFLGPATLALTLLALTACSEPSAVSRQDATDAPILEDGASLTREIAPGLVQTITVKNRVHTGDILEIQSVVRNVSKQYQKAEALLCHPEIRTDLAWDPMENLILCFAYSGTVRLAPQDTLVLTASGRVKSPPGRYLMVIQHLLRPELKSRIRINVYPKTTD